MMKKLLTICLLLSLAGICRADYELRLNDGVTLRWSGYSREGDQYCTQKAFGKFCLPKRDVVSLREIKDSSDDTSQVNEANESTSIKPAAQRSHMGLSTEKKVLFEFYSSHEKEVQFAYLNNLKEKWHFRKMLKDGDRFYIYNPVDEEIWYEFVVPTNTWYRRDPFNRYIDNNHPYLKRGKHRLITSRNLNVRYVSSEHFDYFTTGDGKNIVRLEEIYRELTGRILPAIFKENFEPIYGKKIRYYGGIFPGTYSEAGSATIIDYGDRPSSHEMIHVLLYRYPHFGPFAEGIAQCLQEEGNHFPLTEQNCSLAAQQKVLKEHKDLWDVLGNFSKFPDYHLAGSFVYFHLFVERDSADSFIRFLRELKPGLDFNTVRDLYRRRMGKDMHYYVKKWNNWVKGIDETSDVFVHWNEEAKRGYDNRGRTKQAN